MRSWFGIAKWETGLGETRWQSAKRWRVAAALDYSKLEY